MAAAGAHTHTHTHKYKHNLVQKATKEHENPWISKRSEPCDRFAGLMMGFQSGMPPAPDQVRKVAEEMDGINEQWRVLLTRQGGLGFRVWGLGFGVWGSGKSDGGCFSQDQEIKGLG
jgi:hypothetical protein